MQATAITARRTYEDGDEVDDEILVRLTRYVESLVDEIDVLIWRATVAHMALNGEIGTTEVVLG